MKRSGSADLPLHGGRVPPWLPERMTRLGTAITETVVRRARAAAGAITLDEADTRKLIDAQLRAAGWEADSDGIRWSAGSRRNGNS